MHQAGKDVGTGQNDEGQKWKSNDRRDERIENME